MEATLETHEQIIDLLRRIEENQRKGLEAQEQQLGFARQQLERSGSSVAESLALQRVAVARQQQVRNIALPLIVLLLVLLAYLLVKWRVL